MLVSIQSLELDDAIVEFPGNEVKGDIVPALEEVLHGLEIELGS